jgi:hypothetical protein
MFKNFSSKSLGILALQGRDGWIWWFVYGPVSGDLLVDSEMQWQLLLNMNLNELIVMYYSGKWKV